LLRSIVRREGSVAPGVFHRWIEVEVGPRIRELEQEHHGLPRLRVKGARRRDLGVWEFGEAVGVERARPLLDLEEMVKLAVLEHLAVHIVGRGAIAMLESAPTY